MVPEMDFCFSASKHFCAVPVAEQQSGAVLMATAELCALNVTRSDASLRTQAVSVQGLPGVSASSSEMHCATISDRRVWKDTVNVQEPKDK